MEDTQTNQGFKKTNAEDDARRKNEQELVKASILKQVRHTIYCCEKLLTI